MTKILVPPGIGDIMWVICKIRGFLAEKGITEPPEIWIDAPNDRKRSIQFVERLPFVKAGGYYERPVGAGPLAGWKRRRFLDNDPLQPLRHEAYLENGRSAFPDFDGHDWFLCFNGALVNGRSLEETHPEWPVEWDFPQIVTNAELIYGQVLKARIGPYVIAPFFDAGYYRHWMKEMPAADIYRLLSLIHDHAKVKILLTGARWDHSAVNLALLELDEGHGRLESLIGETSLEEYFGALRAAEGCIGFPAGNTMMATTFRRPTTIIWNDYFDSRFHRNCCPPESLGRWYVPMNTKDGVEAIADAFLSTLDRKEYP